VIIAIIGVISVFVAARISGGEAQTRGFYDELLSQVQYARKLAIAQRRRICVHMGPADSRLYYSNPAGDACPATSAAAGPTGEAPFTVAARSGITVTTATFQFDALGRYLTSGGAAPAGSLTVAVTGDGSFSFIVEGGTGYVHR